MFLRSVPGPYGFNVTIAHSGGGYHIVPTAGSAKNFQLYYFLSETAITNGTAAAERSDLTAMPLNKSIAQQQLDMTKSLTIQAEISLLVLLEQCKTMHFICFTVDGTPQASYVEKDSTNNIHCTDFDVVKNCTPGK